MRGKLLIFGRSGQVAREFAKLGAPQGFEFTFVGRDEFNLLTGVDARPLLENVRPAAVINCAAYTAVDQAEREPEDAYRLNRDAPAELARACAERSVPFIHFSTDYVFDGKKSEPYLETDLVNPVGVYGSSKAAGEQEVLAAGGPAIVLRTSWVYSAFGTNFVKTMLRLGASRQEIRVVSDQLGRPTWAEDCARGALRAVQALIAGGVNGPPELYHLAGQGDATWAEFAEAIFEQSARGGRPFARVKHIATRDYETLARRPANSRLDCGKMTSTLKWPMRPWRQSLAACLRELESVAV